MHGRATDRFPTLSLVHGSSRTDLRGSMGAGLATSCGASREVERATEGLLTLGSLPREEDASATYAAMCSGVAAPPLWNSPSPKVLLDS